MKTWTITLENDPETGDLVLPLSQEILDEMGWKHGDELHWTDNKDGTWSVGLKSSRTNEDASK